MPEAEGAATEAGRALAALAFAVVSTAEEGALALVPFAVTPKVEEGMLAPVVFAVALVSAGAITFTTSFADVLVVALLY